MLILLAAAVIVPSGERFECEVVRVSDGDTWLCSNGVKVRLRAVDAPELPGHCRKGRHCAPGDPFASKRALERLIAGRTVQCVADGRTWDRTAAWCSVDGVDLSCAQFRGGWAIHELPYDRQGRLCR